MERMFYGKSCHVALWYLTPEVLATDKHQFVIINKRMKDYKIYIKDFKDLVCYKMR